MGWITTIVMGGIVGWIASIIMKTNAQMGLLANVLVGVIGAAVGFWLAGVLGIAPTGGIGRFLVALGGAVVLLFVLRSVGMFRK
ncbi:MAG TPA: GlsB/YeaQ/YmgE family stress response membrane protein [Gemmatimonadota bacterium]|nr:GlsB/YeaQ/YmgE family stress response membrane protein [Gemmatimonadota bacterium]